MKKIVSLSIALLVGLTSITFAKKVVYRKLNVENSKRFKLKCYREKKVSKARIERSFNIYQNNVTKYRRAKAKDEKKRHRTNLRNSYQTLERYCPNTARNMLRK